MRRFVDLHTHSTASDGSLSPGELIAQADRAGLAAVALTDHDTASGLAEARQAARQTPQLRFIGGMEVSALYRGGTMHILAFGVDETCPAIIEMGEAMVAGRDERNPLIIAKLREMGIKVSMEDVQEVAAEMHGEAARTVTSRVHIAETLRRKGLAASVKDAFDRYIGTGGPAYVDKERMKPSQVVRALRDSGAIVSLAHPAMLNCANRAQLERVVRDMIPSGLGALEIYHSSHTAAQVRGCLDLARHLGLEITGGSDFHGLGKPEVRLGHPRVPVGALTGRLAEMAAPDTNEAR